jgi:hypothetical protein
MVFQPFVIIGSSITGTLLPPPANGRERHGFVLAVRFVDWPIDLFGIRERRSVHPFASEMLVKTSADGIPHECNMLGSVLMMVVHSAECDII